MLILQGLSSMNAHGALIGVIDSGTDVRHQDLVNSIWRNPDEISNNLSDDDDNSLIDDIYGWNFAENNADVIDYKYLGSFSPEVYRFFTIQSKMVRGEVTPQEIFWLRQQMRDPKFAQSVGIFGNFIHGTHVSGISLGKTTGNKLISLKIIPTEVPVSDRTESPDRKDPELSAWAIGKTIEMKKMYMDGLMAQLSKGQAKELQNVASYLSSKGADVANGSFGTSSEQIEGIISLIFNSLFDRLPTQREKSEYSLSFMKSMLLEGEEALALAPKTLFVFAAGNDGSNNDESPVSPANISGRNVISVAATQGRHKLASFSNYGKVEVDVAAPGVNIHSTIPGNEYIRVSGTSQAAPYVTHAAAEVKNANPNLGPESIKKILMGTVDYKSYLADKVISKGVVNTNRAVKAAELSRRYHLEDAIRMAKSQVADVNELDEDKSLNFYPEAFDYVLPLPSMLKWKRGLVDSIE